MAKQRWIYYCEWNDKWGQPVYGWSFKKKGKVLSKKTYRF